MWTGRKVEVDHTWGDAVAYAAAPVDAWGKGASRSSHRKSQGDGFHALEGMPQALEAMRDGWSPGRERIGQFLTASIAGVRSERVPTYRMDVAGERPHVPLAVAGDPHCMFRRRREAPRSRPVVRIVVNVGAMWWVKADDLARRGAAILAYADALEASGWTTSIDMVWHTVESGGTASLTWRVSVKPAGERFDIDRLSFALVCPDFMRRAGFAVLEGCPDLRCMQGNYGVPTDAPAGGAVYFPAVRDGSPWATVEAALASVRLAISASRPEVLT